jgi:hypothetical protein
LTDYHILGFPQLSRSFSRPISMSALPRCPS